MENAVGLSLHKVSIVRTQHQYVENAVASLIEYKRIQCISGVPRWIVRHSRKFDLVHVGVCMVAMM